MTEANETVPSYLHVVNGHRKDENSEQKWELSQKSDHPERIVHKRVGKVGYSAQNPTDYEGIDVVVRVKSEINSCGFPFSVVADHQYGDCDEEYVEGDKKEEANIVDGLATPTV